MMNQFEKVENIINNILELYNFEMGTDYTFKKVDITQDITCNHAFGIIEEEPFLYFSVYVSTLTDFFNIEIFTINGVNERETIFCFERPF